MKRTTILTAVTAACLLSAAGQAQVVISQVYGGGGNSGATLKNDFIELKNIGAAPVTMNGWSVQYSSAAGTTWAITPLTTFTLQPGQYYLVKEAQGAGGSVDLPTPDATGTIAMGASAGKVVLAQVITAVTGPTDPNVKDLVGYGTAASAFEGTGPTLPLSNTLSASRTGNGCDDTNNNATDFGVSGPTPHNSTQTIPCGVPFPDLTLQFGSVTCQPIVGDSYEVVLQMSNLQALPAAGTVATIVLPPTLSYVSSNTGGSGTTSYNAGTRTLTWNTGTVGDHATPSLTINGTVVAKGGLVVTAAVSTTTPNEPTGNNTATSYNEVLQTDAPLGVIAVGSSSDPTIATNVDENGTARQLGTIYRSFTSPNGEWIIFRTDLAGLPAATNGGVVIGHRIGNAWTFSLVAREGTTAPVVALPNAKIDNSGVNNIQGINNAGQYVYSAILRETALPSDILTDVIVKGTVAGGISSVIVEGDAATAAELAGRNYNTLSSTTIQNDGTISFQATLTGTGATNAVFLKNNGNTVLAQKGVTTPTGATLPMDVLDNDGSSDGRGLTVSADGSSWLGTGEVQTAGNTTTDDNVVVVNGVVVVREGTPVAPFTEPAGWATFGSQQLPWGQMFADGHWMVQGINPTTVGFGSGQDWVMRDGTVITSTGALVTGSGTETWSDASAFQRTFFVKASSGTNVVVGGTTNRHTLANGSDDTTDGAITYNNQVVLRKGSPVQIGTNPVQYVNIVNDDRTFISGDTLYVTATLRNNNSECSRNFTGLPQAIVAVPLPVAPPSCIADVGVAGGGPGQDGMLDNNDFIAFITYFFAQDPIADMGIAGGFPGSDSTWDNNDFIAFINHFFDGCP